MFVCLWGLFVALSWGGNLTLCAVVGGFGRMKGGGTGE